MTEHFLLHFKLLTREDLEHLSTEHLGQVIPVTCEMLADYGIHPEHDPKERDK